MGWVAEVFLRRQLRRLDVVRLLIILPRSAQWFERAMMIWDLVRGLPSRPALMCREKGLIDERARPSARASNSILAKQEPSTREHDVYVIAQ